MAIVSSNLMINNNDYEKVIPLLQTALGIAPTRRFTDDSDIASMIIAMQTAASISPVSRFIDRQDYTAKLIAVQVKINTRTATVTIASPAVVTSTAHGFSIGTRFRWSTTGALPTGITAGVTYHVITTGFTVNAFQFSTTAGGTAVVTTGSQSGIHSIIAT